MEKQIVVRRNHVAAGLGALALFVIAVQIASSARAADPVNPKPSHQVIACYFHRTQRCPTCRTISAYIEQSIRSGFAAQIQQGSVNMAMVDFQDPRNKKYAEAYNITGPTLVIMDVRDDKVTAWKPAPKAWSLVGKKDEFVRYVQGEVQSYLTREKTASR